jgi:hypothetical protein
MIKTETYQQEKNNSKLPSFNKDFQKLLKLLKDPSTSEKVSDLIYPVLESYLRNKRDFFSVVYWDRFENKFVLLTSEFGPFICPFGPDFLSYFGIYRITSGDQNYNSFVGWLKSKKIVKKNFFINTIDKEGLTLLIKEELINLIPELTNSILEAKEVDSFIPLRDLILKDLLIPFDFLSPSAQFQYYWKNLDLFKEIQLTQKRFINPARNETLLKFHTPMGEVECIQPAVFSFHKNQLVSDLPFCLYEEQLIDYLINFLNNPKQSFKEKIKTVDCIYRIVYYSKNEKLDNALKEFQEKQFLKLYFFDKLDELKSFYRKNNPTNVSLVKYSGNDYVIQNLLNSNLVSIILGIDRVDFYLKVRPKIEKGLIELFDYLNNFIDEYCKKTQKKNSMLEYHFRIALGSQIHPELLALVREHYKGQHPLL